MENHHDASIHKCKESLHRDKGDLHTCRNKLHHCKHEKHGRGNSYLNTEEMTDVYPIDKATTKKSNLPPEILACIIVMLLALSTVQHNKVKKLKTQVSNPKVREIEETLMNKS